jgi:deoxyribonuclease IV
MVHIFGTHAVDNGGIDMAARRARAAGLSAVQIFTAIPKYYGDKSSIREERVARFRTALAETGIRSEHVVVHAAYVLNMAIADPERRARAHAGLARELERSSALGAGGVCFHPGSAGKGDVAEALGLVSQAMVSALEAVPSGTKLWVENTAGAGATLGRTPEEVAAILARVPPSLRPRTGYGLDTCHLFSAGHDIVSSPAALGETLDAFAAATGEPPSFFHLNDSQYPMGSNRDRHALLGAGQMGEEPFRWLLADPRSHGVPLILETPQHNYEVAGDDAAADPYDVAMRQLLERLAAA